MKNTFVLLFGIAAFSQAFAAGTDICGGQPTAHDATAAVVASTDAAPAFVVNAFTPKCSANVYLAYEQDATAFAVGAASAKGKNVFSGSTNGGGVTSTAACAAATCAASDATGATADRLAGS
jgi:hypothetical protein